MGTLAFQPFHELVQYVGELGLEAYSFSRMTLISSGFVVGCELFVVCSPLLVVSRKLSVVCFLSLVVS